METMIPDGGWRTFPARTGTLQTTVEEDPVGLKVALQIFPRTSTLTIPSKSVFLSTKGA